MCLHVLAIVSLLLLPSADEKIKPRFGIEWNDKYLQKTPKDTLRSVLTAIEAKRVDYVLAHLADPEFVDARVKQTGGRFEVMVKETTQKLDADPESMRELRKFLSDGEWKEDGDQATAQCREIKGKKVYFKKMGERWFLKNNIKPAKDQQP